ncbi:hypothetical protein L9G74_14385 [Shewanella sp. C32]|uniref:Uncharacterized protein n=1 Tax=Shewanella electrica TaxID=515560 RepID=A0ABT2FMS4_9GAMM|nr:hypothetical protein [Shewanella electrica]MCH1926201.1 hypothetical protein [Shewanella electrica]MCS4557634.1 hypothetical protein [Shewanella electrica]
MKEAMLSIAFFMQKKTVLPYGGTDLEPKAQFFTLSNVNNLALRQKIGNIKTGKCFRALLFHR